MSDRIQHLIDADVYQTCPKCHSPGSGLQLEQLDVIRCRGCDGRGWIVNPEWVEKAASFVWNKFPRYELNYPEIERMAEAVLLLLDEEDTPQ